MVRDKKGDSWKSLTLLVCWESGAAKKVYRVTDDDSDKKIVKPQSYYLTLKVKAQRDRVESAKGHGTSGEETKIWRLLTLPMES